MASCRVSVTDQQRGKTQDFVPSSSRCPCLVMPTHLLVGMKSSSPTWCTLPWGQGSQGAMKNTLITPVKEQVPSPQRLLLHSPLVGPLASSQACTQLHVVFCFCGMSHCPMPGCCCSGLRSYGTQPPILLRVALFCCPLGISFSPC
jgi:hypothetical protein